MGRWKWMLREVALMLPIFVIALGVALRHEDNLVIYWILIGGTVLIPPLMAYVLSSLYAGRERQDAAAGGAKN